MDLKKKMIVSFILVSLIPFASGLVMAIKKAEPSVKSEIVQKLGAIQKSKKLRVKEKMKTFNSMSLFLSRHRKFQDAFVLYEEGTSFGKSSDEYKSAHKKYDPFLKTSANEMDLDDLILISNKGEILASGKDSTIVGMNALDKGGFGKVLKNVLDNSYSADSGILFVDYMKIRDGGDFNAYFITRFAPNSSDRGQWKKGESIGAIALGIHPDTIDAIVNERTGLGKTGETYIVGMNEDGTTSYRSTRVVKKGEIGKAKKGGSISAAFKNKPELAHSEKIGSTGVAEVVYSSYIPDFGMNWALFTTQSESEAMSSLYDIYKVAFFIGAFFGIVIIAFSLYFSNSITKPIQMVVENLSKRAESLRSTSTSMEHQSQRLSSASTEQASSLQQTAASIDEISAMIDRNTESSTYSKDLSTKSNQVAIDGKMTITDMIRAIEDINESNNDITNQMQESNRQIEEIVQIINEIGEKTKVINDIVFQTKLLSFNASVEAARAGEDGKGFAVVAEEVGNLANMSGQAANEISDMLEKSVVKVKSIVEQTQGSVDVLIAKGREKVETGTEIANKCGIALDEILQNVSLVNDKVAEIAQASIEQSSGVQQITAAVRELDIVAHENSNIASESTNNVRVLKDEALGIATVVSDLNRLVYAKELETKKSA
ncbi:methyl-accepting chemotaxis protein [Halobacteriovorax sp. GB3]|uniref:methyl-accepting chemotaxis protein n=1 Tax=Halobacteriovorax sp. GB3 TaxID=2719615 RepID=UPI00235ECC87|nr:methyl-accepting chemotaxis protein [Halobacteriovorax sp. GB3]MDD0852062.1 methyl-accepting chemotaxis protein [Halobacteriovorax sp. GB3]